jgi:hypothetical protein
MHLKSVGSSKLQVLKNNENQRHHKPVVSGLETHIECDKTFMARNAH